MDIELFVKYDEPLKKRLRLSEDIKLLVTAPVPLKEYALLLLSLHAVTGELPVSVDVSIASNHRAHPVIEVGEYVLTNVVGTRVVTLP